jgi:hypothetical protein
MRKTLGVAALMLALCCPALAGEIPTPPAPQPPTVQTNGIVSTGDPAPVDGDGTTYDDDTDILTQIVLNVLASLLP